MKNYLLILLAVALSIACGKKPAELPAAAGVSYTVPEQDKIQRIKQPTNLVCWATVGTMMWTWKNKQQSDIETVLDNIGNPTFLILFQANKPLKSSQKPDFLESMGMKFEYSSSFTPAFLESKLKVYGPIWVTTHEGAGDDFSMTHARICYGIKGDGTAGGTFISLVDPATGTNVSELFSDFIKKYEQASGIDIQMVHW